MFCGMCQINGSRYLREKAALDLGTVFGGKPVTVFVPPGEEWPSTIGTLDDSQRQALRLAFSSQVALIQGPPGQNYVDSVHVICRYREDFYWSQIGSIVVTID